MNDHHEAPMRHRNKYSISNYEVAAAPASGKSIAFRDAIENIIARGRADTISVLLIALMFLIGLVYFFSLPNEITIYPGTDENGVSSKVFGLFVLPFAGILLYVVLTFVPPLLNPRRKQFPERTAKYIRPAALAYFLYTQISIIVLNKSEIVFSSVQNLSVITGIGILYAAAQIYNSKSRLLPKLFRSAKEEELISFNEKIGKALGASSILAFLGFFAEKYFPVLLILIVFIVVSFTVYCAYTLKKKDNLSVLKHEIERSENHETFIRSCPEGRGLIGSVSSSPTGNSDLKDGVQTVVDGKKAP